MQVSGSFLESRTAKMDAPAVSQRRSTLKSVAFACASAIGLPGPASFNHTSKAVLTRAKFANSEFVLQKKRSDNSALQTRSPARRNRAPR